MIYNRNIGLHLKKKKGKEIFILKKSIGLRVRVIIERSSDS